MKSQFRIEQIARTYKASELNTALKYKLQTAFHSLAQEQ